MSGAGAGAATEAKQDAQLVDSGPFGSSLQTNVPGVALVSTPLPAVALPGRRFIAIQNRGATSLFVNDGTAVGASWEIKAGATLRTGAGPTVALEGIRTAGAGDVLVWEFA